MARHPDTDSARDSFVSVRVTATQRRKIDAARGPQSRSNFVREAINEKIEKESRG